MTAKELIIQELKQVPEPLLEEVLDFLQFLKMKQERDWLENEVDLRDAHAVLAEAQEQGTTSLGNLKRELGL
ncbi:DUF2281 domain-containing protein [Trichocoleus desertorum AS-A10]|uniref:hypothetical protein n=1 Tax=Trichocoleus desertorum TaxID=1481672 RepID=UPI0032989644